MFGRNAVADALGVKSAKMVSQSSIWVDIADTLGLSRRSREGPPARGRRVGLEIAVEQASQAAPETADHATPEAALMREEQEVTLARINKLARSGQADAHSHAKALRDRYQAGEMTDEQVRQTVDALLETD
jgi:hypothetical protein